MLKPNAKGKVALLIIAALIFIIIGFVCGQLAKALNTLPGDADDPVATQSYVEGVVGERLATLLTRVEELEAEIAALKGNNPGGSTTTPNTGTVTPNTGTVTPNTGTNTPSANSTLTITGNTLNIRSGPGTNYEVVGSLAKGDKVTRLGTEGEWYRIQHGNVTGYISVDYAQ